LSPAPGLGILRRIVLLVLLTWVPIVVWAALQRRLVPGVATEPLLQHFGVHVRCLVAIPLFVAGEAVAEAITRRIVPYFVSSGLVRAAQPRFVEILRALERLRDSGLALPILAAITVALVATGERQAVHLDEVSWALTGGPERPRLGFGGWWFLFVVRPVFLFLLLLWAWRFILGGLLLWRIARLDLDLVPTHPDRAGGLGFLQQVPIVFSPIGLAMSAVIASRWAHDVLYHQQHVVAFRLPLAVLVVTMLILVLSPLLAFSGPLRRLKRASLFEYGALVGEYGRLVQRRWIRGEQVDDKGLLGAPEIGPVADVITMYEAVGRTRPAPVGMQSVLAVVAPVLLPMIPVLAIEVPIKEMLLTLLKTLT
jgi:hypothetical protein